MKCLRVQYSFLISTTYDLTWFVRWRISTVTACKDTDKFIHDQCVTLRVSNLTSIVLFCFLQPDEKTYIFSLMKFHSMPWWHWMEVKKIFRVLVFDWMTRSNKQQTSSFLISTPTSLILIPLPTSSGTPVPLHHCATWTYLYIYGGSVCEVEYQGQ